jgi:hypothetical protein
MSSGRALFRLGLCFVSLFAAGCSTTAFDGKIYDNGDLAFRVSAVPREWRQIDSDGALLAFRDDGVPANRVVENEVKMDLDGREALQTQLTAKLDGVEKRYQVVVFKKNGCVYDFVHVAPPEAPADGRRRFIAFVQGFSTIKP